MIAELIAVLTDTERETLRRRAAASGTQLYKFILALLDNPNATNRELQKQFGITANTCQKNLSLAKDEIYDVIKHEMRNAYDDMLLPHLLYNRGLEVQASKLRIKLENEYETQGWWNILQEFYNMEMIVAYTKCDLRWLKQLCDKSLANNDRLHRYVKVDREIVYQMAVIENGNLREKDFAGYERTVRKLLNKAREVDHPIPVFNALHSLYMLHTQYDISMDKSYDVLREIHRYMETYGDRMIPYAKSVVWLNTLSFHTEFATDESPTSFIQQTERGLNKFGLLFDAQVHLNICTFHFYERDVKAFEKRRAEFRKIPAERSFGYQSAYLDCLYAYLRNDRTEFVERKNAFHSDETSRAYNDYDLTLRYLEMLLLIKDSEYALVADRLEATKKYVRRNFTRSRYAIEQHNWELIRAAIGSTRSSMRTAPIFRLTEFIREELVRE